MAVEAVTQHLPWSDRFRTWLDRFLGRDLVYDIAAARKREHESELRANAELQNLKRQRYKLNPASIPPPPPAPPKVQSMRAKMDSVDELMKEALGVER